MIAPLDKGQLRRCFSTLGCADLSFSEICELAKSFGIAGLELRGIGGRMDMPAYCSELGLTTERVQEICAPNTTALIVAGSSLKLTDASEKDRTELLAFCAWAEALDIPYVRVFGGGTWGAPITDTDYGRAVDLIDWWRTEQVARGWEVELLLETHDAFSASEPCLKLNQRLERPIYLIWDSHHTWRCGGESPESTWGQIGQLVRHVHIKDSVDHPSARHPYTYVLPGEGQMPLSQVIALLRRERFDGFASLEWERFWHPYLPPLRDALARLTALNWFTTAPSDKALQPAPILA